LLAVKCSKELSDFSSAGEEIREGKSALFPQKIAVDYLCGKALANSSIIASVSANIGLETFFAS
jgi:hypothetical protein